MVCIKLFTCGWTQSAYYNYCYNIRQLLSCDIGCLSDMSYGWNLVKFRHKNRDKLREQNIMVCLNIYFVILVKSRYLHTVPHVPNFTSLKFQTVITPLVKFQTPVFRVKVSPIKQHQPPPSLYNTPLYMFFNTFTWNESWDRTIDRDKWKSVYVSTC